MHGVSAAGTGADSAPADDVSGRVDTPSDPAPPAASHRARQCSPSQAIVITTLAEPGPDVRAKDKDDAVPQSRSTGQL